LGQQVGLPLPICPAAAGAATRVLGISTWFATGREPVHRFTFCLIVQSPGTELLELCA
jgi:hypothetical protein